MELDASEYSDNRIGSGIGSRREKNKWRKGPIVMSRNSFNFTPVQIHEEDLKKFNKPCSG